LAFANALEKRDVLIFVRLSANLPEAAQRIVPALGPHITLPHLEQLCDSIPFVRLALSILGSRKDGINIPNPIQLFDGFLPALFVYGGAGFIVQSCDCLSPVKFAASRHAKEIRLGC
jgi:hypothetical protein